MSYQLVQACIDMRGGLFTPAQKAALLIICRFADDQGMNSFPKLETIAERTEFNRRTILEAVKELIENGWITAVRTQYGRNFTVSIDKIMANRADVSEVQESAHVQDVAPVQEHAHVQETTSRCAGSCITDVQEPAHRKDQLREQEENISSSSISVPEPLTLTNDETLGAVTRKKSPAVPFAQIVEIYNAKLGNDLGICRKLSETRKSVLRQRWKDVGEIVESSDPKEILSGFGCYYDKIARSSFLMGRATNFKATFDWIHKSENFIKTYEGNYENGRYRN
jgi:hypothetical protein|nr:MAG TPA: helix-turn-helix domain protein [Caudoviricetes sp.]